MVLPDSPRCEVQLKQYSGSGIRSKLTSQDQDSYYVFKNRAK
jgi:hypothetical protein